MNKSKYFGATYITLYVWLIIFAVIIGIIWYWRAQVGKKSGNVDKMKAEYKSAGLKFKSGGGSKIQPINSVEPKFTYPLKHYFISTSYNTCCAGDFQDSYVTLEPIKEVLESGARVLDFEIYSVDDKCVVAASPYKALGLKGTYNSLPINDVLNQVQSYAFSSPSPNPTDPLFLMFRIKSGRKDIYAPLADAIVDNFGSRLMDARWSYGGRGRKNHNIANVKLNELQNKVIIIGYQENNNFATDNNKFWELINITPYKSGTRIIRTYDAMYPSNPKDLINLNKLSLCICLPDLNEISKNPSAIVQQNMGCQMSGMSFQQLDENMKYYLNYFEEKGTSFVLKPKELRSDDKPIKCPAPQDPNLSLASKEHELAGGFKLTL